MLVFIATPVTHHQHTLSSEVLLSLSREELKNNNYNCRHSWFQSNAALPSELLVVESIALCGVTAAAQRQRSGSGVGKRERPCLHYSCRAARPRGKEVLQFNFQTSHYFMFRNAFQLFLYERPQFAIRGIYGVSHKPISCMSVYLKWQPEIHVDGLWVGETELQFILLPHVRVYEVVSMGEPEEIWWVEFDIPLVRFIHLINLTANDAHDTPADLRSG